MPMITPHLPAQPTASGGMLLLGVHSWQNVDALRRRRVIRKLNREELNHDGLVVMRFIMPERKPLVASARGKMLPMVQRRERTSRELKTASVPIYCASRWPRSITPNLPTSTFWQMPSSATQQHCRTSLWAVQRTTRWSTCTSLD